MQLEYPHRAALVEEVDLLGHIPAPQRHRAAPASRHTDVLLAILIPGDRRRYDAGSDVERPDFLAGLGIGRLEEPLGRAPEHQTALGRQHTAPQRRVVGDFPFHLAGLRVERAQRADVLVVDRLDGETGTQVGRALLVADRLVPDFHAPLVGRHVEIAGIRAVGHRHLVLAAEERRHGEYRLALLAVGALGRIAGTVGRVEHRLAIGIEPLGPGDLLDEGEALLELAGVCVEHVEEAVAVGLAAEPLAAGIESHELVHTVVVPAVVRRALEVPFDLAGGHIDRHRRA